MFDFAMLLKILSGGVIAIGAFIGIWGGIQIGMAVGPSSSGGGAGLAPGIGGLIGGIIIAACGGAILLIDTSWASF